jgi:hypothetical protein
MPSTRWLLTRHSGLLDPLIEFKELSRAECNWCDRVTMILIKSIAAR